MPDLFLNWGDLGPYGSAVTTGTTDTGGVNVSVSVAGVTEGDEGFTVNNEFYTAPGDPFNPTSTMKLFGDSLVDPDGSGNDISTTVFEFSSADDAFADTVQNVSFRLSDIDAGDDEFGDGGTTTTYQDIVTVRAFDADGNEIPVSFTPGSGISVSGNTLTGTSVTSPTDSAGSALVEIAGPVARIEIDYNNGGDGENYIDVSDVHFSTIDAPDDTNSAPVAEDDAVSTPEDTPLDNIDVLGNDSDPDGDPLTVTDADAPNGSVTINGDGTLNYTPDPDFFGDDTITYTIEDPDGATDTAEVIVTVDPVNDAPVANDDTASTDEDTPVENIDVLGNDTDVDGDPLTVTDADAPNGSVTINADGTLNYTPDTGFTGDDTITYTIEDPDGATDTAEVIVTVDPDTGGGSDGIVDGTGGDDTIDTGYTGDPDGDFVDNDDNIFSSDPDEADDDIIRARDGDDTVDAGEGNDNVDGGTGNDVIDGGEGDDTILGRQGDDEIDGGEGDDSLSGGRDNDTITGGDGNDTAGGGGGEDEIDTSGSAPAIDVPTFPGVPVDADPEDDRDSVLGADGDDTITTGDDRDTIDGGRGDDVINPGIDDDLVEGGGGNDLINDPQGADTISGGGGADTIIAGVDTFSDYVGDDPNLPIGAILSDPNVDDGRDLVDGGAGNDLILTGDDSDTITGGTGNDTIDAGIDDDSIDGGAGRDSIVGGHGSDTIFGGDGNDSIDASARTSPTDFTNEPDATDPVPDNDRDFVDGGDGNDTIFGGDDDDTLLGGTGNDVLSGGIDEDSLVGGDGNDTLTGGAGADTIDGGDGRDMIMGGSVGDVVDGGSGPAGLGPDGRPLDFDTLDLRGSAPAGGTLRVTYTSADREDGIVEYFDDTGASTGTMTFEDIENVIPCFTPGTTIATPTGERLVEDLREGDRVITRDNGLQEIRWIGSKDLSGHQLARTPHMRPILIQAGSLGPNLPEHDILVSPQHRILINNDKSALYFEEREVLAAAKHLTDLDGVDEVGALGVTYIHFMFDQHEVVLSNGAWTESFQPGDQTLGSMGNDQQAEIFELFPELETADGIKDYASARRALKKHEAKLLMR